MKSISANDAAEIVRKHRVGRFCLPGICGNGNSCFGTSNAIGVGNNPGSNVVHARGSVR